MWKKTKSECTNDFTTCRLMIDSKSASEGHYKIKKKLSHNQNIYTGQEQVTINNE